MEILILNLAAHCWYLHCLISRKTKYELRKRIIYRTEKVHSVRLLEVLGNRSTTVGVSNSVMKLTSLRDSLEATCTTVASVSAHCSRSLIHHRDHHHLIQSVLQVVVY